MRSHIVNGQHVEMVEHARRARLLLEAAVDYSVWAMGASSVGEPAIGRTRCEPIEESGRLDLTENLPYYGNHMPNLPRPPEASPPRPVIAFHE